MEEPRQVSRPEPEPVNPFATPVVAKKPGRARRQFTVLGMFKLMFVVAVIYGIFDLLNVPKPITLLLLGLLVTALVVGVGFVELIVWNAGESRKDD